MRFWHRFFGHGQTYSWTLANSDATDYGWWYVGCQRCGNNRVRRYFALTSVYPY